MFTQQNLNSYITRYLLACEERGIKMQKVILFGSYAKGNANDESDIDLALVSDEFSGRPLDDRQKISSVNIRFSDIEPHTFNTDYFEAGDPFINEIKRTGISFNWSSNNQS